jgi:CheY-like chemotaxis protein
VTDLPPLILLVEDEPLVRETATDMLHALGYRAVTAADGNEALSHLAEHPDVALLFTDVVMPGGLSGFALAQAAHRLRPDLKVVYATGYAEEVVDQRTRPEDGPLIRKPYRLSDLAAALRRALGTESPRPSGERSDP